MLNSSSRTPEPLWTSWCVRLAVQVWGLPVVAGLGLDGGIAGGGGIGARVAVSPGGRSGARGGWTETETAVAVNAATSATAGWYRVVERHPLRWTVVAAVAVAVEGLLVVDSGMV